MFTANQVRAPFVAMALALAALAPRDARACSCNVPATPGEAKDRAAAVFAGKVTDVTRPEGARPGLERTRAKITVSKAWKTAADAGDKRELVVETPAQGAMCGVPFNVGEEWLVYAFASASSPDVLTTTTCSRSKQLAAAAEDLAAFGAPPPSLSAAPSASASAAPSSAPSASAAPAPSSAPARSRGCGCDATSSRAGAASALLGAAALVTLRARRRRGAKHARG